MIQILLVLRFPDLLVSSSRIQEEPTLPDVKIEIVFQQYVHETVQFSKS